MNGQGRGGASTWGSLGQRGHCYSSVTRRRAEGLLSPGPGPQRPGQQHRCLASAQPQPRVSPTQLCPSGQAQAPVSEEGGRRAPPVCRHASALTACDEGHEKVWGYRVL